jgi:iron(III) transport system ATP-binding protein
MAVLDGGHILQVGTPQQIYRRPARKTVADFIGETNFIPGTLVGSGGGGARVATGIGEFQGVFGDPASPPAVGSAVTVSIRPECLTISTTRPTGNSIAGRIGQSVYLGENAQYDFVSGGASLKILELNPRFVDRSATEEFHACVQPEDVVVLGE